MNLHICIIPSLKEFLNKLFGDHYPNEIVQPIMSKFHKPIKINCGFNHAILSNENRTIYVWGIILIS